MKVSYNIAEGTTNLGGTSMNYSNKTNGSTVSCSAWGGDAGTCTFYHSGGYNNYPYKVYHKTATGTGGIYYKTANDITIEAGKTYTMSVYIKASVNVNNASAYSFNINRGSDNNYINYGTSFNITTNWQRLVKTFTATSSQAGSYGEMSIIYDDTITDYYVYYSGFQIEEKNHATAYVNGTRADNTIVNFKLHTTLLPPEYQQVEYIESSGTQYINTGYVAKVNNVSLELDMAWTGNTLGAFESFMGFMYSTSTVNPRMALHKYSSVLMFGANATTTSGVAPVKNERFVYKGDFTSGAQKLYKNGTQIATNSTTYNFSTNTCPVYIFARYCPNGMNYSTMRVYRAKIYEGTTLKMDFIPCYRKSDSVIGLYDIVNKVFYSNSGTGNFTKGNNNVIII